MAKIADAFVGAVFGRLTVTGHEYRPRAKVPTQLVHHCFCTCSCGAKVEVLTSGLGVNATSCGCYKRDKMTSHGLSRSSTYKIWTAMLQRTTNPNHIQYEAYKDKAPPATWHTFEGFLADMGEHRKGLSLDRKDNSRPYSKDNCRWTDDKTQQNNKKESVRVLYRGEMKTVQELAENSPMSVEAIFGRLSKMWTAEEAVNLPKYSKPTTRLPTSALVKLYPTT